jgi:hypothetical protein
MGQFHGLAGAERLRRDGLNAGSQARSATP